MPGAVPGLPADARPPSIRAFSPADLDTMVALDRDATGEDREHLVRRFADPGSTRVAERDGLVVGSTIRASWGGGATIVASDDVGLALLDDRRVAHGPGGRVRIGLLEESGEAIERLLAAGLTTVRVVPRMVRGEPVAWHPRRIWGEFNFAVG